MAIRIWKIFLVMAGYVLLSPSCKKIGNPCPKDGYEYLNTNSHCWYSPSLDSLPLGTTISLAASVPKTFIDENTQTTILNTCSIIHGPLGIVMISPIYQAAIDSFEIKAQIGKVIKDTINFSTGQLKGFRTIEWDGNSVDSFKMKITIKPIAKGIYACSLNQQSYKDKDCALYKYFLSPGNTNQHLNYWTDAFGSASNQVAFSTYCFKIY